MKRKDFDLNEIFTYNNLYESYKSVCKSCRSKFKKTNFSFFLYSNLIDIFNYKSIIKYFDSNNIPYVYLEKNKVVVQ